jgi:hypothetical protein
VARTDWTHDQLVDGAAEFVPKQAGFDPIVPVGEEVACIQGAVLVDIVQIAVEFVGSRFGD